VNDEQVEGSSVDPVVRADCLQWVEGCPSARRLQAESVGKIASCWIGQRQHKSLNCSNSLCFSGGAR